MFFKKLSRSKSDHLLSVHRPTKSTDQDKSWWQRPNQTLFLNIVIIVGLTGLLFWSQLGNLDLFDDSEVDFVSEESSFRPLDTLSSSDIAHSLASLGSFREITWVEVQSYNSRVSTADIGGLPIVSKPAVINSTIRTRKDILQYIVSPGDTVISLAHYFDVSSDSIRWSNGIKGNSLRAGNTIIIPPSGLNGIVHQVESSDNLIALYEQYSFSSVALLNFNDLDSLDSLPEGEFIFLPNASPASIQTIPEFLAFAVGADGVSLASVINPDCHGCGQVKNGDVIGKLGNTGWSTGPHLHLEIITYDSRHHNPWAFINQNGLIWPVDQRQRRVTQIYHSGHRGLDIGHEEGVDIFALDDGEVIYRGCIWEKSRIWSTFGIIIDHGNYYSLYIHLQAPDNKVYAQCSINRRSQYGSESIDYSTDL